MCTPRWVSYGTAISAAARSHSSTSSGATWSRPATSGWRLTASAGLAQVPLRHEVGVDVVVHHGRVLVRPGHAVDPEAVLGVEVTQRRPQPRGLDEQLGAEVAVELLVQGGVVVPDDGVGDVGVDVEGRRPRRPVPRGLLAADRAPREGRARACPSTRARSRAMSRVECRQRSASRAALRSGVGEHRQHVGLGVPEGVPVVPGAGEPLGRDGLTLAAQPRLQDVEHAHPDGLLQFVVARRSRCRPRPSAGRAARAAPAAAGPSRPAWRWPGRPPPGRGRRRPTGATTSRRRGT